MKHIHMLIHLDKSKPNARMKHTRFKNHIRRLVPLDAMIQSALRIEKT